MLENVFSEPLDISARTWTALNLLWAGWFALLAVANIYIAHNFDDSVWVNFKVFGLTGAILVFMIPQVFWLNTKIKHPQSDVAPP
jgi:intracellular septation protein